MIMIRRELLGDSLCWSTLADESQLVQRVVERERLILRFLDPDCHISR